LISFDWPRKNDPSVFVLISATVYQIDGSVRASGLQ
jgi:hypothetical protein